MEFLRSSPGADPIIVEGLFKASVERVFRAWTEPDEILKWFGSTPNSLVSADIDLRVGGRWCFVVNKSPEKTAQLEGEYLEIEPEQKLTFTWSHKIVFADGREEITPHSLVRVSFEENGAATTIKLRHEAIENLDGRKGVGSGWETSFAAIRDIFSEEVQA